MSTVIGINFGASASSVAVISKEGLPDCIANDDGERQISNAIAFSGEEEYIGIPAKSQLVRNNANTILGFRNLLGKSYDSVKSVKSPFDSAPLAAGPNGEAAYKVTTSKGEEIITAQSVATKYLEMLISIASDFLGRKIDAAVIAVPSDFTEDQLKALEKAAQDAAGIKVLQFVHEPATAAVAYNLTLPNLTTPAGEFVAPTSTSSNDRNVVVLDIGATTTTSTVLAARQGTYVPLATVRDTKLGGEQFDDSLISFFSKEFTKKTKATLDPSNHRAMMKLRLACEVVKRSLSASTSATCSVESLSEGMDFSGSINRTRFDLLSAKLYSGILDNVSKALKEAKLDPLQVQEVVLVGGTCKNPTIADKLGAFFPESTLISSQVEPDQVIARGAVLQARALADLSSDESSYVTSHSALSDSVLSSQKVTSAAIGLLVPAPTSNGASSANPAVINGKIFVTVLEDNTPLPARRIVDIPFAKDASNVKLPIFEGEESIHVEAPPAKDKKAANGDAGSDDEYSDEEEEDVRTRIIKPTSQLAELVIPVKSSGKDDAVRLTIIVSKDGKVEIEAVQNGQSEGQKVSL